MKRFHHRRSLMGLALAALVPAAALAQPKYPDRPARVVVGFPAGGPTDLVARLAARHLAADLGQPFVVDNKGGAAGNIGTAEVVRASPDGYTALIASLNITINPAMMDNVPFDSQKDIRPVRSIAVAPTVLVVRPDFPARTYAEFVAELRRHPDRYNAAAQGSSPLVATELFSQLTGTKVTTVAYQGAAPAMLDLMTGTVDLSFATLGSVISHLRSGKIRAIAIASPERSRMLPEVPTFAESGMKDFSFDSWTGLFVPSKTPEAIVQVLAASLDRLVTKPEYGAQLAEIGMTPIMDSDPARFAALVGRETALYAQLGKGLRERRQVQKP